MIDLDNPITQRQFAELIGVSEAAVSGMVKHCVIIPGQSGGAWLRDYCGHLREQAAGRAAAGDLDLATERARLAKEQADKVAMQNAITRGELAPVMLLEEVLSKAASKVAGIFDAIPSKVRRRVPKLTSDEIDLIAAEVAKARNAVAAMSLADLNEGEQGDDAAEVVEA